MGVVLRDTFYSRVQHSRACVPQQISEDVLCNMYERLLNIQIPVAILYYRSDALYCCRGV